jgi:hypothetical protein
MTTKYVAPKPHRPLITERGATHCTCGVFCNSTRDLAAWRAHAQDRFILDPTTRLNPKPIGSAWWTITESFRSIAEQHARVARHLTKSLERMKLS